MDELDEIRKKKMEQLKRQLSEPEVPVLELPDKPVEISDATIEAAIRQYPLLVVDCWAEWCGPCRSIAPVIEDMARELKGKAVFGKLNVDKNPLTSRKYGITAIPTLLVFQNGRAVDRLVGAYPKASLMSQLKRFL
ncbi:MAG: Thioredoxin [Methanosaeta sp. PtaB.Bin039]|nr:MAG: Thioredoxin [Methanosaeta sp. PtaB.Bin039]OPY46081.1 MAG: Thioredoxin [Methanosaeta sp. PtaU1.Bin028]HOT06042.1 thioredoxin [Methanotrichaceae archaeon]HQF16308.1 thioredoxin [Methanotrichaceae archaeon]HQI90080.1 thioredoxin [Methanotrichaceae archaeon]